MIKTFFSVNCWDVMQDENEKMSSKTCKTIISNYAKNM